MTLFSGAIRHTSYPMVHLICRGRRTCVVGCRSVCRCALIEVVESLREVVQGASVAVALAVGELFLERRTAKLLKEEINLID